MDPPLRSSPPKQRRGSLPASPALNAFSAWAFRDEMGLPQASGNGELLPQRAQSTSGIPPAPLFLDTPSKRMRKKWSDDETNMLVAGCNAHGVGNWKAILNDPKLKFEPGRTAVDLKDRFRTHFPDAYRQHYPNARTHLSDKRRATNADGSSIFEKTRTKRRRPFSPEEDEALRRGYEQHGTVWATIVQDPIFQAQQRRSTDLRDRFRNAFPDLYEAAGYKGRGISSKKSSVSGQGARSTDELAVRPARTVRRRLTYPGLVRPTLDDAPDSSGEEDEGHPNSSKLRPSTSHSHSDELVAPMQLDPAGSRPSLSRRSTSPAPDHDSISISSHSHLLSGPGSPTSPKLGLASPDGIDADDAGHHIDWNALNWMSLAGQPRYMQGASTSSSLFSGNFFASHHSAPRQDVLDRYDLYSSPLASSMNAFGDYASEMGMGGSFSEADMDLNAFAGPASSMGFTHHSQVAGDLIFASHHGGHLQHGHGFGLHVPLLGDAAGAAAPAGLGLSDIGFPADPSVQRDVSSPFLDPIIDGATLALLNPGRSTPSLTADPFDLDLGPPPSTNFGIAPAELHKLPIPSLTPTDSMASLQQTLTSHHHMPFDPMTVGVQPGSSLPSTSSAHRRASPVSHLRSASQPPTELRPFVLRREHLASPGLAPSFSTPSASTSRARPVTRDDAMQHYPNRAPDPYPLPFLDLHYYYAASEASMGIPGGRPPDRQGLTMAQPQT